jgi:hypothetical protein
VRVKRGQKKKKGASVLTSHDPGDQGSDFKVFRILVFIFRFSDHQRGWQVTRCGYVIITEGGKVLELVMASVIQVDYLGSEHNQGDAGECHEDEEGKECLIRLQSSTGSGEEFQEAKIL